MTRNKSIENRGISPFLKVEKFGETGNEQGRLLQQNNLFILITWVQGDHGFYCGQLKSRTPRNNAMWQGYTFGCSHPIRPARNNGVGFYSPNIYEEWHEERHGKQQSYAHGLPEANPGDAVTACIHFYSQNLPATSPIPIPYDKLFKWVFCHSQPSLLCPPEVLGLLCSFSPSSVP